MIESESLLDDKVVEGRAVNVRGVAVGEEHVVVTDGNGLKGLFVGECRGKVSVDFREDLSEIPGLEIRAGRCGGAGALEEGCLLYTSRCV